MICYKTTFQILVPAMLFSALVPAQSQTTGESQPAPVYRIDVVSRTAKAINFQHRQGSTVVGLEGSSFAPKSKGEVKVDSKTGATKVDAVIEKMPPASTIAEGYLTYVLWAITPEGRPENLGELMLDGDRARLQAATELQSFGLIVTAEPYYAVTQPSDYIIMEGVVKQNGTTGTIMPIEAKYELVSRGGYLQHLPPADRVRLREAKNIPLDLMEARQAMAVARAAGAGRLAADTIQKAEVDLQNAEALLQSGSDKKKVQSLARHVTQLSEDARLISVRKAREEALAQERAANERREMELAKAAQDEEQRRLASEREAAAAARAQAEAAQREREAAAAKQRQLELEALRARDTAQAAQQKQAELEQQARLAREAAERAEADRAKLRSELVRQLNLVLATRETARGMIVNMSDVLFDTGRYTLKPGAREKLSKVAGIILVHSGLKIEVEGHTDSTGTLEFNQKLSEERAEAVRAYLVSQGVSPDAIVSRGFGQSRPVAENNNAAGRQANRRVELVVNGPLLSESVAGATGSNH
jgi:outer membrane protein OmpA-like peptidoglycan-associated protein